MTMDYNKWGVVTGIVGLVLLLVWVTFYVILSIFDVLFSGFVFVFVLGLYLSLILGIAALALGIHSIRKGEDKKAALVLGIICIILSLPLVIIITYQIVTFVPTSANI